MEDKVQAFRIGAFDIAGVTRNIDFFSDKFASSIRNISSGKKEMDPVDISMSTALQSRLDELDKDIQSMQDRIGMMELNRSEVLIKLDVTQRIRELAVAYNNGTLSDSEKNDIQTQVNELSKLLSDDSNKLSVTYQSSLNIAESKNLSGMDVDIITEQTLEEQSYTIYDTAEIDIGDLSLEELMASNSTLTEAFKLSSEESGTYVYESVDASTRILIDEKDSQMFDLSKEGALANIDKTLESFASSAASITSSINATEYALDAALAKKAGMEERLNNMTAADLAEETAEMMKAKVMMGIGAEVLKAQQELERENLFKLLTAI